MDFSFITKQTLAGPNPGTITYGKHLEPSNKKILKTSKILFPLRREKFFLVIGIPIIISYIWSNDIFSKRFVINLGIESGNTSLQIAR
jgi:hypothetical protein